MRIRSRSRSIAVAATLALALAGTALAIQKPGRTIVRNGTVRLVALNHASLAIMVQRSTKDCDHVELWNTDTKALARFGKAGVCSNLGSTGTGISALGVSGNRALWVRYTGGNIRDWQLMTATTTQKTPRQVRVISQDVNLASPFAIGDSTGGMGIPYAAGKEIVLLGANGVAVFKFTDSIPITRVTAGKGPAGAVVAALRTTGDVVLLRANGSLADILPFPAGAVKAISLAPGGVVVQVPTGVEIHTTTGTTPIALPTGAALVDYAGGRILYTIGTEVHARSVATGADTLLLKGTPAAAVVPTYDTHGLGWAKGASVNFACAVCLRYSP